MRHRRLLRGMVGIFAILASCATVSTFPDNGAKTIDTPADFDQIMTSPQQFSGQPIKVAGRISRVESHPEGVILSANWLPYPANGKFESVSGNVLETSHLGKRLALLYPQTLDPFLSLQGNMFIAIGQLSETKNTSTFMGATTTVPNITVQCLRVWKTGSSELNVAPDTENTGYPPMVKTYCVSP
jgi:starvation-inducible outer membrane lipoprotein